MKKYIAVAGCVLFLAGSSHAGELDRKIKKLIKPFVESAQAVEGDITVAVFPFQTDEKLAKKRVNFAVSELLIQELHRAGMFKLVERSQLDAVVKEQKLGISGVVDSATAAKLGKLLGAGQIILGSVSKLGRSYQINARLVDSDTGEIIAPSIVDVPVAVFDEEATRYLTLVPERQTIGLQLVMMNIPLSVSIGPAQTVSLPFTATPRTRMSGYLGMGIGARYFPTSWLAVEGTFFFPEGEEVIIDISDGTGSLPGLEFEYSTKAIRFGAAYTRKMSEKLRLYGGIQIVILSIDYSEDSDSGKEIATYPNYNIVTADHGINFIVPALRLGGEWRPQSRIGLSIFGNLALSTTEKTATMTIYGPSMTLIRTVDLFTVKYPALSIEGAFTFYF